MQTFVFIVSAVVILTTTTYAQNNSVTLTQVGNAQRASVDQTGNTLTATVVQQGTSQTATISQAGAGFAEASITQGQNTDGNQAIIRQVSSGGGGNYAIIEQVKASSNQATISQNLTLAGVNNFGTIRQGSADGVGLAGSAGYISNNNQATIVIEGTNNRSRIFQVGDGNTLMTSQYGEGNLVKGVIGNPSGINPEEAVQLGEGNTIFINQASALGSSFSINTVSVYQNGTGNISTVNQGNQ